MGKRLIIKGADFSENALFTEKWYNSVDSLEGNHSNPSNLKVVDPIAIDEMGLIGKPVNIVKIYGAEAGTITIGARTISGDRTGEPVIGEPRNATEHPITIGENIIKLTEPIILSEGESIYIYSSPKASVTVNYYTDEEAFINSDGWCFAANGTWGAMHIKNPIVFGYSNE